MTILGPLVPPRTSAVTLTLANVLASAVTASPSTCSTTGSDTDEPTSAAWSVSITSPMATFCWPPPLRTTAYTTGNPLLIKMTLLVKINGAHYKRANRHALRADGPVYGDYPSSVKTGGGGPAGLDAARRRTGAFFAAGSTFGSTGLDSAIGADSTGLVSTGLGSTAAAGSVGFGSGDVGPFFCPPPLSPPPPLPPPERPPPLP